MKIDLKKDLKHLYRPGTQDYVEVDVPPMTYLAIEGHGDPNTSQTYAAAVSALYVSAYSVKARFRTRTSEDFVVGPLEGLWSSADPGAFTGRRKDEWDWTMLIALPDAVDPADQDAGLADAAVKRPLLPVPEVQVITLREGTSLQIMHVGSYDDEAEVLARLHDSLSDELARARQRLSSGM